jgi:WD40 repeat protein
MTELPPRNDEQRIALERQSELLADSLIAYDEELRLGVCPSMLTGRLAEKLSPESLKQFNEAAECIRLLHVERISRTWTSKNAAPASADAVLSPQQLGRFRIIRELGKGGHGIVLLAYDPRLDREVSIKLPRTNVSLPNESAESFVREARSIAAMSHPNIIEVHEVCELGPVYFIVQAYCDGPSLKEWLHEQRQPISNRIAATIVRDLSDAVHHSHSKGFLHRDLKPSNVLLQPVDPQSANSAADSRMASFASGKALLEEFPFTPKLTDFGISTPVDNSRSNATPIAGGFFGTPQYMAPEQARNRQMDLGWPTDVYGLGAILYEVLTGSAPFRGDSPTSILRQVVNDAPKRPRLIQPTVSVDLEAICLKCLEKDPARRYESASELRCDLERYLAGFPIVARSLTVPQRFIYWCRRKPLNAAVLLFGLLIFFSGLTAGWWHFVTLGDALARAEEQRRRANSEASNAIVQRNFAEANQTRVRRHLFCLDAKSAHRALLSGSWGQARQLLRKYEADRTIRDSFVWRYLWGISHQFEQLWQEHEEDGRTYCVAFTPDGTKLVGGTESGLALIWDVATRRELHRLSGHTTCINSISISSDGRKVATASCDRTVRIWNIESGALESIVFQNDTELYSVCFSPDCKSLAIGDESGRIFLCDPESQKVISSARTSQWRVTDLAFSGDASVLIAASGSEAFVFESDGLKLKKTLHDEGRVIHSVAYLNRNSLIAWGGEAKALHLSDSNDMSEVSQKFLPNDIWALSFDKNEQVLVCGGGDRIGRVMEVNTGKLLQSLYGHTGRIVGVAMSPDAMSIATASFDGSVRLWSVDQSGECLIIPNVSGSNKLAFAADGELLIVSGGGSVRAIRMNDWTERYSITASNFAVSPDVERRFLAAACDDRIQIHESTTGQLQFADPNSWDRYPASEIGILADGRHVFGSFKAELLVSIANEDGPRKALVSDYVGQVTSLSVLPNESAIVAANSRSPQFVTGFNYDQFGNAFYLTGMNGMARQLAADRSGQFVAAASDDHLVYLWEQKQKNQPPVATLSEHRCPVTCVGFSPDGRLLVSGDESGIVCIWNTSAGHTVLVLDAHDGPVAAVAFSPDGTKLVTSSEYASDGTGEVKLWVAPEN